jgi:ubiquinone biosynthesis protein COQ9
MYYTRMEQLSIYINSFTFRIKANSEISETQFMFKKKKLEFVNSCCKMWIMLHIFRFCL